VDPSGALNAPTADRDDHKDGTDRLEEHEDHDVHEGVFMLRLPSVLSESDEKIVEATIGCGIEVHRHLGPGLKERIYEVAFGLELEARGVHFECEKSVSVKYKDWTIPGQRVDLIVERIVIVEIKSVPRLKPIHRRQLISYLRSADLKVGLLMNFNTNILKNGLKRVVV
jgi:GxxExxY protein